jgi:hypothetical protein
LESSKKELADLIYNGATIQVIVDKVNEIEGLEKGLQIITDLEAIFV